uniref:Acetylcholinesterase n=1 Tax=Parastrongyloides trichosuri TaxID=131310 RepID=A0A0N4ZZS2_PARTI
MNNYSIKYSIILFIITQFIVNIIYCKYIPGKTLNFTQKGKVDEYLGIPYAKPPVGSLRFMPPVKADYPNTTVNASNLAKSCPQYLFNTSVYALDYWNPPNDFSEDCLQFNMWVPENKTGAVFVMFCGASYYRLGASSDVYNGSVLAAYSRAIIITLNFRLGALGFGRFKGTNVTGNMGLLDQQLGLQWIKDHISDYGGDPKKVTIMGEQTGASSVEAHLYSEGSKELFKRIAVSSGTLENPWASRTNEYVEKKSSKLSELLGCGNGSDELNACKLNLTSEPITGDCKLTKENFTYVVDKVAKLYGKDEKWKENVSQTYSVTDNNATVGAQSFLSSFLFDCGLIQFADKHAKVSSKNKSYVYILDHRSIERRTSWPKSFGTIHAGIVEYLFGRPFRYPDHYYDHNKTLIEQVMSRKVMELYGHFVAKGTPDKEDWKPYDIEDKFVLNLNNSYRRENYKPDMSRFERCEWLVKPFENEIQ